MARDDESTRRRENMMDQRLRKARGEEVEDTLADETEEYIDRRALRDDDYRYTGPRVGGGGGGGRSGGGCAQAVLYLVLGAVVTLLIGFFFFGQAMSSVGQLFGGISPRIQQVLITPTPSIITGAAVVQQIKQLSRLETSRFTIEQVIEVEQGSNIPVIGNILAGDALLLIAHGNVIAGIDLTRLASEDIVVSPDGKSISVRMPAAEVFSSALDSQKTRVYSRDRGVFAPDNKDLESQARMKAELSILQAACEGGIMQEATENGEAALRQLLGLLDFDQISIQSTTPALPPACQQNVPPAPTP
jgi:Protein of unknown function (DUF4230)